jgi:hypothetical protein
MRRVGHIYFARCNEYVKVGFSTDCQARLSAISACSPYDVELVGLHEGTVADERRFHKLLAPYHHKREWFRWCSEVREIAASGLGLQQSHPRIELSHALEAARLKFGGDSGLARALGDISSQAVSQWRRVPALRVLQVERASGISRHSLRPDLYPSEGAAS